MRPEAIDAAGFGHEPYAPRAATRRYEYAFGKALVFGSGFRHSTEPGRAAAGTSLHAYLCFTFGTDEQRRWPEIARTLDTQSRVVKHPDGQLGLSHLGEEIQKLVDGVATADEEPVEAAVAESA